MRQHPQTPSRLGQWGVRRRASHGAAAEPSRLPLALPQMLLLLTRPQGASRASPRAPDAARLPRLRCLGSRLQRPVTARKGCPPYLRSSGALLAALPRVPRAPVFSRATMSPVYHQPGSKEDPLHPFKAGPSVEAAPCRGPRCVCCHPAYLTYM